MALYSKRQFAQLAQVPTNNLSNYIKRGRVVLLSGKPCHCPKNKCTCLIDSGEPTNALFLERNGVQEHAESVKSAGKSTTLDPATGQKPNVKAKLIALQEEKLERQNEELSKKNRLLEAKIQKVQEEVIPRELAAYMIKNYSAGIRDVWLTATERFLMQKGTAIGLSREEIIMHKQYVTDIMNDAIRKGAEVATASIRRLAREYSGKKEKGERGD